VHLRAGRRCRGGKSSSISVLVFMQEDVAYELRAWRDSIQAIRLVPGRQPWMPVSVFVEFGSEEHAAECVHTFSSGFKVTTSRSVGVVEPAKC
jgi:hypothetical protein